MFVCDFAEEKTFYKDIDIDVEETIPVISDEEKLRDVSYFNGALYWTRDDNQGGIAVMTNYDQGSPSFDLKETSEIESPFQLVITETDASIVHL